MEKIKSLADLKKRQEALKSKIDLRDRANNPESHIQVKVSMSTCGIASGAKHTMEILIEEFERRKIDAIVTQTGCMGYCYAEPTIEVKKPGLDPIVFGYVNEEKAIEIVEKYIQNDILVEGIIPVNYQSIDNK
ncbi:MAG: (2Fe-2S) ferredoxin domain-containing protein [Sphingobacteriia bacterium]|nr:(2Fe-2S) ferredoxin domain-containing protein [Sphingobacteriia bacterium]